MSGVLPIGYFHFGRIISRINQIQINYTHFDEYVTYNQCLIGFLKFLMGQQ